jgi:hypothetical protein
MKQAYKLLIPALLLITMLIGSVSGRIITCPDIPDPPYIPELPEEDIIQVEAYIAKPNPTISTTTLPVAESLRVITDGTILHLTVTFAAETPPSGHALIILVTILEGNPETESILDCASFSDPTSTSYNLDIFLLGATVDGESPNIAVYAWLGELSNTDRAPNDGFYPITSMSASEPNVFQDYEPAPVGGVMVPKNSIEILTPYIALAGLVAAISTVYVIKKRK